MKKKLLTILLISTLAISTAACGNSSKSEGEVSTQSEEKQEEKKEPLNLTGTWRSENNDGSWMEASITDDVITINWVSDNGDTKSIYWVGTYVAPKEYLDEYTWTSNRDKEQTDSALMASTDDTKDFTYKNKELTYEASALGTTKTMRLTKSE